MRILAVDDDPIILELLADFLADIGNQTLVTANSAAEALSIMEASALDPFDFFLLDIQMPGMNGIELTKLIQQQGKYRDTPIIMLTAMADKAYIDVAFAAGATDYVTKPFEANDLRGRLALIEMAVTAKRGSKTRPVALQSQPLAFNEPIGLNEPISLFDVENVISHTAMENYALQLARGEIFGSSTFAFAIRDIETLHDDLCPFEFHSLISDVAEVISDTLAGHQFLMTYSGSGVFVCVTERKWAPVTEKLMDQVNLCLSQTELYKNNGETLDVRVSVGRSVRFVWKTGQRILDALGEAHEQAEQARAAFEDHRLDFWAVSQNA